VIVVGLTGSIGMGKSTAARMFAEEGIPVIGADDIVHALYSGRAVPLVGAAFPGTVRNGVVDRAELSAAVLDDPAAIGRLEAIVHPLVREEEAAFVERQRAAGADMVVVDIPLLFETGAQARVDRVVVVSCDPNLQRQRVLARPGMTEEKFEAILARQMPDSQKRQRADFVIDTNAGFEETADQVRRIVAALRRDD
jgi:dephospho-CoA kinase